MSIRDIGGRPLLTRTQPLQGAENGHKQGLLLKTQTHPVLGAMNATPSPTVWGGRQGLWGQEEGIVEPRAFSKEAGMSCTGSTVRSS